MAETRKLAAILASDVVGYSRLAGTDEDRTLARLRALRSDLIDPIIAVHNGRVVKRTGDGVGQAETDLGRCEQSIAHIRHAFALSPRDPVGGAWHAIVGLAEICRGRLDAAIEQLKRAIDSGYPTSFSYALLAGVQAEKGNDAEAKLALAEARRLNPRISIKFFA